GFIDILTLDNSTPDPSLLTRTLTLKSTTRFTATRTFIDPLSLEFRFDQLWPRNLKVRPTPVNARTSKITSTDAFNGSGRAPTERPGHRSRSCSDWQQTESRRAGSYTGLRH